MIFQRAFLFEKQKELRLEGAVETGDGRGLINNDQVDKL